LQKVDQLDHLKIKFISKGPVKELLGVWGNYAQIFVGLHLLLSKQKHLKHQTAKKLLGQGKCVQKLDCEILKLEFRTDFAED